MNERLYCFKYDDKVEYLQLSQARTIDHPEVKRRIGEIILNSKNKRMIKDGFEPGFQDNINEYCGSKGEYDRRIRELGLVEIGYETKDLTESTTTGIKYGDEFIEHAKEIGVDLTGNEIEAIKTGEYFDESLVNVD